MYFIILSLTGGECGYLGCWQCSFMRAYVRTPPTILATLKFYSRGCCTKKSWGPCMCGPTYSKSADEYTDTFVWRRLIYSDYTARVLHARPVLPSTIDQHRVRYFFGSVLFQYVVPFEYIRLVFRCTILDRMGSGGVARHLFCRLVVGREYSTRSLILSVRSANRSRIWQHTHCYGVGLQNSYSIASISFGKRITYIMFFMCLFSRLLNK